MDKTIDMLQIFYGGAIRNKTHNVDAMYKAIWAVFFHNSATDEIHDHSYCPSGEESWCKYSRAVAKNLPPPTHKPLRIPVDLAPYVKPVFEDLSKLQLLERCIDGATQNQNESFNNIIWSRCPKTGFCSLVTVETALGLAILTFKIIWELLSLKMGNTLGVRLSGSSFCRNYQKPRDAEAERTCCSDIFHFFTVYCFQFALYHYLHQLSFRYMPNCPIICTSYLRNRAAVNMQGTVITLAKLKIIPTIKSFIYRCPLYDYGMWCS